MVQFCKFNNVRIVAADNPHVNFIVFHHRFEELVEGCVRVANYHRFQNMPCFTQFHIERDGAFLLDDAGKRILV